MADLHDRLISRQADSELERKRRKARRRGVWTQEEIDWADRWLEFIGIGAQN